MPAKYIQIANLLKNTIENHSGDVFQLPTESALCQKYNVSRQTVRKALSVLEKEHLIKKRQGSGSYATGLLSREGQNTIAVLTCSNTEYTYPRLLADLCSTLQEYGFSSTVYVTANQISKEREILSYLLENPVRGILSEGCKTIFPTPNHDLYRLLAQKDVSISFFRGNYSNLPDFLSVKDDNYEGGYTLGKYLVSLGHQKIGGIFNADSIQGIEQYFGVLSALRDAQVPICEDYICRFDTSQLTALQKRQDTSFLSEFISRKLKNTTAVICCDDEIAYWLIKELSYKNIRVPDDISVICFGCSYLGDLSPVPITCLSHRDWKLETAAAESIIRQIKKIPVSPQKPSWHLDIKRSCAPPR